MKTPAQQEAIDTFGGKLRVRVCGILLNQERILMVQHQAISREGIFWAPPGGGMYAGESAKEALKREFLEETHLQVEVGKLLFVNEYLHPPLHAIELFFEVFLLAGKLQTGTDPELNHQLIQSVQWLTLTQIHTFAVQEVHPAIYNCQRLSSLHSMNGYFLQ